MNKETLSLLKLAGVTALIFLTVSMSISHTSNGLYFQSTYWVMGAVAKTILFLTFSAFVSSLIASVGSKFRNKFYLRALLFSTFLLLSAGIYIFSLLVKQS